MIKTIVFGFDSYNSAGSVRCLGEANIRTTVIIVSSRKRPTVSRSKYIGQFFQVSDIVSGIKILKKIGSYDEKQYLFATSDKVATALDNEYDELKDFYIFPNCGKQGALTEMMNKATMCMFAKECGITVPLSIPYKVGDPIPDTVLYPCLVKPLKSISGSKQDIKHFNTKEELENHFKQNRHTKEYLIQQFIKKDYEVLIIGCRTESGKTIIPAYLHKSRNLGEGDDGSNGYITIGLPPKTEHSIIADFLERINYVGPFSIEMGVECGCPYFFEINLRNDGTINYFTKIGVNIPLMWITDNCEIDQSKPSMAYYTDEFGDFINVLSGKISISQWYKDLKKSTVHKYYDTYDKGPFRGFAPMQIRIIISSILRKITGRL